MKYYKTALHVSDHVRASDSFAGTARVRDSEAHALDTLSVLIVQKTIDCFYIIL